MVVVASYGRSKRPYRDFVQVGGNIRDIVFNILVDISAGYQSSL